MILKKVKKLDISKSIKGAAITVGCLSVHKKKRKNNLNNEEVLSGAWLVTLGQTGKNQ